MASRFLWRLALVAALGWMLVGTSQATTFTLTDNGWTYYEDVASQGWGNFVDPNSVDHMYQNWWWFRTNLDGYEKPLANLVSMMPGGANSVSLVFTEDAGSLPNALLFNLNYTLTGVSANSAYVNISWSIQHIYGQMPIPITVDFFAYSDFDLNGTPGGDTAFAPLPVHVLYNEGTTTVDVIASETALVGYDIDNYPNLLNLLNDSSVYNVSGSAPSTVPGDMTNVFQWRQTLGLGQELRGGLTKVVTLGRPPVIPEPGTWMLMLSGLAPVALRLRKKA
ncbi:MAG: PEP-CTERM sorting domain-containing protein [Armatimonadota bacterium]